MLEEHMRFLARVNPDSALQTRKELFAAIEKLATLPERYPIFENEYTPVNRYHKFFVKQYYMVLYRIIGDAVYIEAVCDTRQKPWKPLE